MAAALVQAVVSTADGTILSTSATTLNFGSTVTAGSTIIVLVSTNAQGLTITADDATNGSYTQAIYNDIVGVVGSGSVHYKHNVTAFNGVRVTANTSTGSCKFSIIEVSGLINQAPTTGSIDQTTVTTHPCNATGLTGTGAAASAAAHQGSSGVQTAATGFTKITNDSTIYFQQYKIGTLSNDTAAFTTANAVNSAPAIALFEQSGGSVSWMPGSSVSQGARYGFVSTGMTP